MTNWLKALRLSKNYNHLPACCVRFSVPFFNDLPCCATQIRHSGLRHHPHPHPRTHIRKRGVQPIQKPPIFRGLQNQHDPRLEARQRRVVLRLADCLRLLVPEVDLDGVRSCQAVCAGAIRQGDFLPATLLRTPLRLIVPLRVQSGGMDWLPDQ